ncbi:MAG: DUF881 domain-containing protein [Bowdeniella nasicola]|nr:DUF881 domain-containing protein [Bowdeniella nasicola]
MHRGATSRFAPRGASIWVAIVATGVGLLFATNAQLHPDDQARSPQNLVELVQLEQRALEAKEKATSSLRERVDERLAANDDRVVTNVSLGEDFEYLDTALVGPGIEVQLWDAPGSADTGAWDPNQLVVHQQDVEAVMNALWAGGAEAMTVQGERVGATTGVRCVGNVLLVHEQTFSPPYVIAAIGDSDAMIAAMNNSPEVQIYREYVKAAGLGMSLEVKKSVTAPAYTGRIELSHAHVDESTP